MHLKIESIHDKVKKRIVFIYLHMPEVSFRVVIVRQGLVCSDSDLPSETLPTLAASSVPTCT